MKRAFHAFLIWLSMAVTLLRDALIFFGDSSPESPIGKGRYKRMRGGM
jgi:hypothetical protein